MSEPDITPDPIDDAYAQAEALLNGAEGSRAKRRAQVLQAALSEPARTPASTGHRSAWRRGGWLAAASLVGFGLFWAADIDTWRRGPMLVEPRRASSPAAPALGPQALPKAIPSPLQTTRRPAAEGVLQRSPMARLAEPQGERRPNAFPAQPTPAATSLPDSQAAPLPLPPVPRPLAESIGPPQLAPAAPAPPPPPPAPEAPPPPTASLAMRQTSTGAAALLADRLRAAAQRGQVAEVEDLLARGVPIDVADSEGDTALMRSVEADQPATAALLFQRGASLQQKNRDGLSAADMARAKDDPALLKALGLEP